MALNFPWLAHYPKEVDWHTVLTPEPVYALMDRAAEKFAFRPCIDFLGKTYNYAEMADLVRQAAAGLQQHGVRKGDRIGLFLPNCPYFVIFYFAVLKAGATVVNFNPLYADAQVKHQIEDSGVSLMVTLDLKMLVGKLKRHVGQTGELKGLIVCPMADALKFPMNTLFRALLHKRAFLPNNPKYIKFADLLRPAKSLEAVEIDPRRDIAVLQYTGGTTGVPKGAMLSHANVAINAEQCRLWFAGHVPGREKMLGVLPFFHVFAMTAVMNLGIAMGAELILLPRFELKQLIKTIEQKKPTIFPAVPTIYTAINHAPDISKRNLKSIKYCISGGAPLPIEVKSGFEKLTGCVLVEGYGLTESSPVTHCNPIHAENRTGTIGLPLPGTIVEIVSLDDKTTVLQPGERGEVCLRGPQVMLGYWKKPKETMDILVAGRLHTGDVGIMDKDGYVQIVDRIKDMIIAGGYNIYPRNVEEQIYLHPAVAECVVAGVADEYRGQTVKAWIALKPGEKLTTDELKEFLADKLSKIEQPKLVEFRDVLPKTLVGKLDRKTLVEQEAAKKV
ncbi:MAG: long-chain fatty acid--CoA ligase [Bdellovibrionales bacterium]